VRTTERWNSYEKVSQPSPGKHKDLGKSKQKHRLGVRLSDSMEMTQPWRTLPVYFEVYCMFEKYDEIVSFEELKTMLHIGKNSAYQLLFTKRIKSTRMNGTGKYIIPKESVINFVNQQNAKRI